MIISYGGIAMINKLRFGLIKLLAGNSSVVMNADINGPITLKGNKVILANSKLPS